MICDLCPSPATNPERSLCEPCAEIADIKWCVSCQMVEPETGQVDCADCARQSAAADEQISLTREGF